MIRGEFGYIGVGEIVVKLMIRDVFSGGRGLIGEVEWEEDDGYNDIEGVEVEVGDIGFCGVFIGVIVDKCKLMEMGDLG